MIHGEYMDIYGHIRTYWNIYGHIRTYTDMYGHVRTYMDIYGHIWTYMSTYQPWAAGGNCLRRFGDLRKMTPPDFLSMYIVNLVICCQFETHWTFFQKVSNLIKWLCQLDAHRNSLQKDVLFCPRCFFKVWILKQFLDFANLGLNVNLKNRGHPKP